jgi:hypothetical protein
LRIELGNIERAAGDTVTATDTIFLLEVDDAVFILDDGAIGRTRAQTPGIFAVHALIFAHQPHEIAVAFVFGEFY